MKANLCLCSASAVIATFAAAQDREWSDAMARAREAEDRGNYAEAESQCQKAVALADRFGAGDERTWSSYNLLGITYEEMGLNAESIRNFHHALALIKSALGTDNSSYAMALANEGTAYIAGGDAATAVTKLRDAVRIEMHSPEPSPVRVAEAQSRLGEALLSLDRRDEAERTIQLALSALTKYGDSVERAIALNNLGLLRRWQRRYGESIELISASIEILNRIYGPDHPLLLRPLSNLAVLYTLAGRNQDADSTFRRAQAVSEKRFPLTHPAYGILLSNYAEFLRKTGEKSRAKAMAEQARSILRDNNRRDGLSLTVDVAAFRHN